MWVLTLKETFPGDSTDLHLDPYPYFFLPMNQFSSPPWLPSALKSPGSSRLIPHLPFSLPHQEMAAAPFTHLETLNSGVIGSSMSLQSHLKYRLVTLSIKNELINDSYHRSYWKSKPLKTYVIGFPYNKEIASLLVEAWTEACFQPLSQLIFNPRQNITNIYCEMKMKAMFSHR